MKVIEKYLFGKFGDPEKCEDNIVVNENFALLLDGVTSKSARKWTGKSVGKMAADILANAIDKMHRDIQAKDAIKLLNKTIAEEYRKLNVYDFWG